MLLGALTYVYEKKILKEGSPKRFDSFSDFLVLSVWALHISKTFKEGSPKRFDSCLWLFGLACLSFTDIKDLQGGLSKNAGMNHWFFSFCFHGSFTERVRPWRRALWMRRSDRVTYRWASWVWEIFDSTSKALGKPPIILYNIIS